jgi:hypothetical protein
MNLGTNSTFPSETVTVRDEPAEPIQPRLQGRHVARELQTVGAAADHGRVTRQALSPVPCSVNVHFGPQEPVQPTLHGLPVELRTVGAAADMARPGRAWVCHKTCAITRTSQCRRTRWTTRTCAADAAVAAHRAPGGGGCSKRGKTRECMGA